MSDDVGDPKLVNPKKKRYQLEEERRIEDFRTVTDTPEGRAVLWRILELCNTYKSSWQGDVHYMLVNEGKRVIGLEIALMFDELKQVGEKANYKMMVEAKDRSRKVEGNA